MNLMIYGNSGSGKTTLAALLSEEGYCHINTGNITRLMANMDCHNLPVIVQSMVASMSDKPHVFDHFYIHTYEQIADRFGKPPVVIRLIDNRSISHENTRKRRRFVAQEPKIEYYLKHKAAKVVTVYNTDYGFDVSELIYEGYLPFDSFAVIKPRFGNDTTVCPG